MGAIRVTGYARLAHHALRSYDHTFVSDCVSHKGGQRIL